MLSYHVCLLISCYSLVFWNLCFDCSFYLIAWYIYVLLLQNKQPEHMHVIEVVICNMLVC